MSEINNPSLAEQLVRWQLQHGRHDLPWQNTQDAYKIWLSEIMLQQTQVVTVKDYYARFLARFPTVVDLANAPLDDVLALWAGLGYYSRARNLHACAQSVVRDWGEAFPNTPEQLQTLRGIGASTAAAIAAFAYAYPAPILDGNVKRILSRVYGIADPPNAQADKLLWQKAHDTLLSTEDAARLNLDFASALRAYTQGVMDLGAGVCRRAQPECLVCPWQNHCVAHQQGSTERIPARKQKNSVQTLEMTWYVYRHQQRVWLVQQPPQGIWAKLWVFSSTALLSKPPSTPLPLIRHRLTHRLLHIAPHLVELTDTQARQLTQQGGGQWLSLSLSQTSPIALPKPAERLARSLCTVN